MLGKGQGRPASSASCRTLASSLELTSSQTPATLSFQQGSSWFLLGAVRSSCPFCTDRVPGLSPSEASQTVPVTVQKCPSKYQKRNYSPRSTPHTQAHVQAPPNRAGIEEGEISMTGLGWGTGRPWWAWIRKGEGLPRGCMETGIPESEPGKDIPPSHLGHLDCKRAQVNGNEE